MVLQVWAVVLVRVAVDMVVGAGHNGDSIVCEGDVETLCVFGLALIASHKLPLLGEDGEVEAVVVACHDYFTSLVDGHCDGIVG